MELSAKKLGFAWGLLYFPLLSKFLIAESRKVDQKKMYPANCLRNQKNIGHLVLTLGGLPRLMQCSKKLLLNNFLFYFCTEVLRSDHSANG